jgi:alanine dehydrogenase
MLSLGSRSGEPIMHIGIPKEIKVHEYRVALTPAGARELVSQGHTIHVQTQAGAAIGFSDDDYRKAGAEICADAASVFALSDMIVKVKEPQPDECRLLRPDQILFAYLHLAADPEQVRLLIESKAIAVAYETVRDAQGGLPLLAPMSEVAGRLSIQVGAQAMQKNNGGNGILLGGVAGVAPANVLIIGAGVVGINAARMAMGLGAKVTIVDRSIARLREIDELFGDRLTTIYSTTETIENQLRYADLVIGAVLVPGAAAPKLISRAMLKLMKSGSVLVDVAIDQGGCFETSRPTTHADPTYSVDGIIHYCVANMPGAVARTAALGLTNASLPYIIKLANSGVKQALENDANFLQGLSICNGQVTCAAVANALGYVHQDAVVAIQSIFTSS